jgi:hypothetical protein
MAVTVWAALRSGVILAEILARNDPEIGSVIRRSLTAIALAEATAQRAPLRPQALWTPSTT